MKYHNFFYKLESLSQIWICKPKLPYIVGQTNMSASKISILNENVFKGTNNVQMNE